MRYRISSNISVFFVSVLIALLQCAFSQRGSGEVTDTQKEEDLIELLNAQQTQTSEIPVSPEIQQLRQRITDLERSNTAFQGEVNTLKSDIVIKDEKIRQLEIVASSSAASTEQQESREEQRMPVARITPSSTMSRYNSQYSEARMMFENSKYDDAIKIFEMLLEENRSDALADNCQYWIGESYFAKKDYKQAIIAFEKVFNFLNSNKDADAQFKLGYSYFQMGSMEEAKREFMKLKSNYPKSDYIVRADSFLQKIG